MTKNQLIAAYDRVRSDIASGKRDVKELTPEEYAGLLIKLTGSVDMAIILLDVVASPELLAAYPGVRSVLMGARSTAQA